jgi:hypothetical protein
MEWMGHLLHPRMYWSISSWPVMKSPPDVLVTKIS